MQFRLKGVMPGRTYCSQILVEKFQALGALTDLAIGVSELSKGSVHTYSSRARSADP